MDSSSSRAMKALRAALGGEGAERFMLTAQPGLRRPTLRVRYGENESVLAPVWAGEGFPKDVERALDDLAKDPLDPRETFVVVARRLSAGARARLEGRGTSWVDEDGRARISAAPGLLVIREPASPTPRPSSPGVRWSDGAGAVAEYILELALGRRGDTGTAPLLLPTVTSIANEVGVSAPFVSRTMQSFDSMTWTNKVGAERGAGSGRVLTDATGLLSGWAAWHSAGRGSAVRAHAFIRDADTFVREQVAPAWQGHRWALTGWLALDHRAPLVDSIPFIELYVSREDFGDPGVLEQLLAAAGLRRVEQGAGVHLLEADSYLLDRLDTTQPVPEVSDIRLYGDIPRAGVRGAEAAEHLRETRIRF